MKKLTISYNFSGGMESAAMLVLERQRIFATGAIVQWANTGKQFPEMADSIAQIEKTLDLKIIEVPRRITFDEFLFERGGMVRKGTTDCSRRMKRHNLMRHLLTFKKPYEVNLGFNCEEDQRASDFTLRNERDWCHWRFPLLEAGISRSETWEICRKAGLSILVAMYEKMGRFDCFWCGNQTAVQALKVADHYPDLAREWIAAEQRKGHSFRPISLKNLLEDRARQGSLFGKSSGCSCFGGAEDMFEDVGPDAVNNSGRG